MNTPTPSNPATEATLPCPFCGQQPVLLNTPYRKSAFYSCDDSNCAGYNAEATMAQWNTRTPPPQEAPAPVTEGAQREAVAYVNPDSLRALAKAREKGAQLCIDCYARPTTPAHKADMPLYTAPPPPDRVQPERVEAEHVSEVQRWKDKLFERYAQQTGTYRDLATIAAEMLVESAAREWRTAEAIANTREIGNG